MKILILSRGIPNVHDPQEGCFELDQAKALKATGHDVVIMAIDSRVRKYWRKPGIGKKDIDGITTYKLHLFPTSIIRRLISFSIGVNIEAKEARELYKYIVKREGPFDLIHAHYQTCIYYAKTIKDYFNIPVIGTEHWSKVNTDTPSFDVRYMGERSYKNIDKLITVSYSLKEKVIHSFGIDSKVIHNLIDTTYLSPLKIKRNNPIFSVVLVGSLIPRKGFDFFIKAFKKSKISEANVKVELIGGGPEYGRLHSLIEKLELTDKINLVGQKNKKDVFEMLSNADVFVLPSRTENFSVSVLEALANGLPVIATICGGIKECINESNGLLVEVDNEDQMANALEEIYTNYNKFDRYKIRDNCLAQYSPKCIANQINKEYTSIISSKNV